MGVIRMYHMVAVTALFNYMNRLVEGFGTELDPAYVEPALEAPGGAWLPAADRPDDEPLTRPGNQHDSRRAGEPFGPCRGLTNMLRARGMIGRACGESSDGSTESHEKRAHDPDTESPMSGHTIPLTSDNFDDEVLRSDVPVLVDYWAPWCGPCHLLAPIVEQIAAERAGDLKVGKVNVDEEPDPDRPSGYRSLPPSGR